MRYTDWLMPRTNPRAAALVSQYPHLYTLDYGIMTGSVPPVMTFGMEIEQDPDLIENNPICFNLRCEYDDSGPLETQLGVYTEPLSLLLDFYIYTEGNPWPWTNKYEREEEQPAACGSHIHIRPNFPEIKKRYGISEDAVIWRIFWNTLLDMSYILMPLLVWYEPRPRADYWARPWQESDDAPIPHKWGRRLARDFQRYLVECEEDPKQRRCWILETKHVDPYRYVALAGTIGDVDGGKPVTIEIRMAETHPLFAATYLYIMIKVMDDVLSRGTEVKIKQIEELSGFALDSARGYPPAELWQDAYPLGDDWKFWAGHEPPGIEKRYYSDLWDLFENIVRSYVTEKGTPYYRAAAFVLAKCNHQKESDVTNGETFWKAISAAPGEFKWSTCNVDTEP